MAENQNITPAVMRRVSRAETPAGLKRAYLNAPNRTSETPELILKGAVSLEDFTVGSQLCYNGLAEKIKARKASGLA